MTPSRRLFDLDDRQFNRVALGGLLVLFGLTAAAFIAAFGFFQSNQESTQWVRHTQQVIGELSTLELEVERSESARRGYLLNQSVYRLGTIRENQQAAPNTLDRLEKLTADNPVEERNLRLLRPLIAQQIADVDQAVRLLEAGKVAEARSHFNAQEPNPRIRAIRAITARVRANEYSYLAERAERATRTSKVAQAVLISTGILLLIGSILIFLLVRRYTRDLTRTRDRLNILNADLEGEVQRRTADLQRANEEIQRFAYIVSHDLRSPLVNIMGFTAELETADRAVDGLIARAEAECPELLDDTIRNAREDLPEAISFIRSSTQKMDRLINAILALSRQGRRVLVAEHLPMDRLVGDIIDTLAAQAQQAGATISIEGQLPDITNDRLAVEQIFSNLIENATKYLQPGRPGAIVIRGRKERGRARFEIADNGRGIAEGDLERIFELFRRSGPQDQKGEGIGLANVRALAYRLGGTVTVRSTLGEGSTFLVDLPAEFLGEGNSQ